MDTVNAPWFKVLVETADGRTLGGGDYQGLIAAQNAAIAFRKLPGAARCRIFQLAGNDAVLIQDIRKPE